MLSFLHSVPFPLTNNPICLVSHPLRTLLNFPFFFKTSLLHLLSNLYSPSYTLLGIFLHIFPRMYHFSAHFAPLLYLIIYPFHLPPLPFIPLSVNPLFPHPYSLTPFLDGLPLFSKAPKIRPCGVLLEFQTSQGIFPFYVTFNSGFTSTTNTKKPMNSHPSPLFCFLGTHRVPFPPHLIYYFAQSTTFPPQRLFVLSNARLSLPPTHLGISKLNTTELSWDDSRSSFLISIQRPLCCILLVTHDLISISPFLPAIHAG